MCQPYIKTATALSDNRKKHLLVNKRKKDIGMAKHFFKSTEIRDELSTTCNLKVVSRCLSALVAKYLHHCLENHRQYCNILS